MQRLVRPAEGRMIAGVCAGLAKYFHLDPTLIRLLWVVLSLFMLGIGGVVVYILAWIIIPEEGSTY